MNDVSGNKSATSTNESHSVRRSSLGKFRLSFRSKRTRLAMVEKSCKELALEGECLCKDGMWDEGIERLEAAIRMGTTDKKTLSALYSQLGNAYFYQEKYSKSLECHNCDLRLTRDMGDKLGEAKASGNIGSALKAMGQYDESIACCRMQLDLARDISNKVLESRALYNLGNVYHARGKHATTHGFPSNHDRFSLEDYVRTSLEEATHHYEANLKLVRELGDHQAQGRTIGNLGNTHHLLGNYKKSIKYHEERLLLAEGDKVACRRAYSNLGNAHVYLGKYGTATQYYTKALEVSKEMGDCAYEAQSCYSLGDVYTLMKNFHKAIEYYTKHLHHAVDLGDRIGQARSYWSLGSVCSSTGDYRQARYYCTSYMQLAVELGDSEGVDTARRNLAELENMLQLQDKYECPSPRLAIAPSRHSGSFSWVSVPLGWRKKMHKRSPGGDRSETSSMSSPKPGRSPRNSRAGSTSPTCSVASSHEDSILTGHKKIPSSLHLRTSVEESGMDDSFLDLLSKAQSERLDDQRTDFHPSSHQCGPTESSFHSKVSSNDDELLDTLWRLQGCRIEDQRCEMPDGIKMMSAPAAQQRWHDGEGECVSSEELFDLIFASQSSRINDQRSPDPKTIVKTIVSRKSTMPNEDFFNLIQHLQSTRIEDQRSPLPVLAN